MNIAEPEKKQCVVCHSEMFHYVDTYFSCRRCGYMASNDQPGSGAEVEGILSVRRKNHKKICNALRAGYPELNDILDVGCSNGLFIEVASEENFNVMGLEPDAGKAEEARKQGFCVIEGFFPNAKGIADKKFDVIVFNDSFEHIPDPEQVIDGIKKCLKKNGVVVVNLPSSYGLIFKISMLLSKVGILSPLRRLWQKGFASPHLHYFNPDNLGLLFEKKGFLRDYQTSLDYYSADGLWKRVRCNTAFPIALIGWFVLMICYPLSKMKSDISVSFFLNTR
jgi:SAM-dependent methyltransferase